MTLFWLAIMTIVAMLSLSAVSSADVAGPSGVEGDPASAAPGSVSTRRAESASTQPATTGPARVLPDVRLTPRDVSIVDLPDARIDLTGTWDFLHEVPASFDGTRRSAGGWKPATVPGHFALQGFPRMHTADGVPVAWTRDIDVPASWQGRRVVLRFEAVDGLARLWVNGRRAGENDIACLPSEYDITDHVRIGAANEITLTVEKSLVTRWSRRELGSITRPVWLQALPTVNLARLHVTTELDAGHRAATIVAHARVANQSREAASPVAMRFVLRSPDGTTRELSKKPVPLGALAAGATIEADVPLRVQVPQLWSAEQPALYSLEAELLVADTPTMSARQRFGFRDVRVVGHELRINDVPVKLRGANYHITYPGVGESVPRELIREDLTLIRDANLNTIRSRPTPGFDYVDLCDEMGLYTTVEAMISLMIYDAGPAKDYGSNPAIAPGLRHHVATMIESLRSHPSIISWGLGNECPYYDYFQTAAIGARAVDPTRPVFFGSDNRLGVSIPFVDLYDDHYPRDGVATFADPGAIVGNGWDYPDDRPNIFTEWMHVHTNNTAEIAYDPGIDDIWGYVAEAHIEKMHRVPHFAGGFHFKAVPYRGVGIPGIWRGLFDDQRRINDTYWHVLKAHSPIRLSDRAGELRGTAATFVIENRFDFTDLKDISFTWTRGSERGAARASVAPHASGTIAVPWGDDAPTQLEARTSDGRLVDRWQLSLAESRVTEVEMVEKSSDVWQVSQDEAGIRVALDGREITIDAKTGLLSRATIDGRDVIDGVASLSVLPAQFRNFRPMQALTLVEQMTDWRADAVTIERSEDAVQVTSRGAYASAAGAFVTTIHRTGRVTIEYDFQWTTEREQPLPCFQWGLAIPVNESFDTLRWSRATHQWSVYPPDHIGRPEGSARARTVEPNEPFAWSREVIDGATRDFRSTKFFLRRGGLFDARGAGVELIGSGEQHLHAVPRDGSKSFTLRAVRFHNGGSEPHLTKSLVFHKLFINAGARFADKVELRLAR